MIFPKTRSRLYDSSPLNQLSTSLNQYIRGFGKTYQMIIGKGLLDNFPIFKIPWDTPYFDN